MNLIASYTKICNDFVNLVRSILHLGSEFNASNIFMVSLVIGCLLAMFGLFGLLCSDSSGRDQQLGAYLVWAAIVQFIFAPFWIIFGIPIGIAYMLCKLFYYTNPSFWNNLPSWYAKNIGGRYYAFQIWLLVKLKLAKYPSTKPKEESYYRNSTEMGTDSK